MDWLFQCNPKRFDLASNIEGGAPDGEWSMNQHRNLVSPGDRVFFWETGKEARLLAVGHVTSPMYARESDFGRYSVGVAFDYKIVPPLTRPELIHSGAAESETLVKFAPFTNAGARGTNFIIDDPAIVAALDRVVEGRLVPFSAKTATDLSGDALQRALDTAIKHAGREIIRKLHDYIASMDPITFQWLVGALLVKLGYKNVRVNKPTGDRGIDVTAILVAGGVANIQTGVQVKRQQNVGRPVVQNLRGSLGPHQAGLLVTSGHFSADAEDEAKDPTRVPIALLNGSQLIQLLLDHQIGVKRSSVALYQPKFDDLSQEGLQARVEEIDDESDA